MADRSWRSTGPDVLVHAGDFIRRELRDPMSDPDQERANRVMQAMLGMVKLDIAQLEAAAS